MRSADRCQVLIQETLSCSRLNGNGCFVTNEASRELRQYGDTALLEIEDVIRCRIAVDAKECTSHYLLLEKHPGLLNLWMVYFLIGEAQQLPRIVDFLRSLDGPVLATGILAMTPTWLHSAPNAEVPKPLVDFVHEVAQRGSGSPAEVASYWL